jgi:hypothetical protein
MQKLLLIFVMMATWIVVGCASVTGDGCYGFWNTNGPKRGTISWKNQNHNNPYRQCVEETAPHKNIEKRPYG